MELPTLLDQVPELTLPDVAKEDSNVLAASPPEVAVFVELVAGVVDTAEPSTAAVGGALLRMLGALALEKLDVASRPSDETSDDAAESTEPLAVEVKVEMS